MSGPGFEPIPVPLGIALAIRMIPKDVLGECRGKARALEAEGKQTNWVAGVVVIAVWLLLAGVAVIFTLRVISS